MSGGKSLTVMGLRECGACRDVKHEQWFPAERFAGDEGSICMVCSTAEGIDEVNRQCGRRQECVRSHTEADSEQTSVGIKSQKP